MTKSAKGSALLLHDKQGLLFPEDMGSFEVSFLHKSFCIAGLPLRRPKEPAQIWKRYDERFALTVAPTTVALPGGEELTVGVPFGSKARLLAIWLASEAQSPHRRADDRWVEIGNRPHAWLERIGIQPSTGRNGGVAMAKENLLRLTFARFTMTLAGPEKLYFQEDNLIERSVFEKENLMRFQRGELSEVSFPEAVQLTSAAHERFLKNSVAIPTSRLALVSDSPMAIDLLLFLCHTLPALSKGESELITWREMILQFGGSESPSRFRKHFLSTIQMVLKAYPEANVKIDKEGLVLSYSDPAVLRQAFIALPGGLKAKEVGGSRSLFLEEVVQRKRGRPRRKRLSDTTAVENA